MSVTPIPPASPQAAPRIGATRIVLLYAAVATLWIAFSDRLLVALISNPERIGLLATVKGWAFVAVTSVLLFSLLRMAQTRVDEQTAGRDQAEHELRENEAILRSYIEDAPLAVFVADENRRIIDSNPAATALTGFTASELRGRPVIALHPESEQALARETLGRLGAAARIEQEIRISRKDGSSVLVLLRAARLASGRSIGFCQDITYRKRLEMTQQESEARLRMVTDNAHVGLVMLDRERRYTFANATYAEILGLTAPGIVGLRVADVLPQLYDDQIRPRLDDAFAGRRVAFELVLPRPDDTHYYSVHYEPTGGPDEVSSVVVVISDITESKRSEAALRESETRLRLLGDNLPDSYVYQYAHRAEGGSKFLYLSAGVEKQNLVKADDVLRDGSLLYRQIEPAQLLELAQREEESLRTMTDFDQEYLVTRPDGLKQWMHVRSRPRCRPDGQVVWDGVATNITERKQAEEKLQKQKTELDAALASMRDAVFISDVNGRFTEFNEAFATFHRFANKEACAWSLAEYPDFLEVYLPDGSLAPIDQWVVSRALRGETASNAEYVLRRKDTGESWVGSYNFAPIRDGAGAIIGSVVTARDITGIAHSRQALQASEERLRALVTLLPDALFINLNNRVVFANQRAQRLWRASKPDDLLNRSPFDLFHPEEHAQISKRIQQLLKDGGVAPLWETRIVALDGTVIPVETSATPIPYGAERAVQVVVRDISERQRAQLSLQASRTLLEDMGRTAHIGGWTLDVVTGNGAWTDELVRIHDADPSLPINMKRGLEFYTEESRPQIRAAVERAISHGESYDLELEIVTAKGVRKGVRTIGHAMQENGRVVRLHGSLQDITERRKLEAQFLRAQRLEAVGTLAGGVAHDLNNILAPVLMATGIVRKKLTDPRDQHLMMMVEASAKRGAAIIRQLLTFSRGIEGNRVCVQLRHLIKDMDQIMEETFPRDIEIRQKVPSDLWTVSADATQMHQVLMNLCVNARDAMPAGGQLTLAAENREMQENSGLLDPLARPGRYVVVSVTDTGTGIPADILSKIFDPFFTTKTADKGTGLGLSTVASIVKSHGGFVSVTSELGKGTTFVVHLPATDAPSDPAATTASEVLAGSHGELILVVDDERSILDATSQSLLSQGYPVLQAADGRAAVELFLQHQDNIRLVLTDLMMPVMGGAALIRALRTIKPDLRIIAATGQDSKERHGELADLGVLEVLHKPCTSEELLGLVRKVLDN